MRDFSNNLKQELEVQLLPLMERREISLKQAQEAINIIVASLTALKSFAAAYDFKSKTEEIEFFRYIKPQWTAALIFYQEIYNLRINRPVASARKIKKYYKKEQQKLNVYFNDNKEFYRYYRANDTFLDKKYFLRKNKGLSCSNDFKMEHRQCDFSTSHDGIVARIEANEKLQEYLQCKLKNYGSMAPKKNRSTIRWTGSKVALVELLYALHTEKVVNEGKVSLKELSEKIGSVFNIEITQFNRIYLEIRNRKSIDRTIFLNSLKNSLSLRMEQADEK